MLLMIDNYDSFTYNLVQYFGELGTDVETYRNDEISPVSYTHLDVYKRQVPETGETILAGEEVRG